MSFIEFKELLAGFVAKLLCKHSAVSVTNNPETDLVTCHCFSCGKEKIHQGGRFREKPGSSWF